MSWLKALLGLSLVLSVAGQTPVGAQLSEPSREDQLLQAVAEREQVPIERLEIVAAFVITYELTQVQLDVAKIADNGTGKIYLVALDAQGMLVDPLVAEAAEQDARAERYGKFDPHLHALLETSGTDMVIPVSIWLAVPDPPAFRPLDVQSVEQARTALEQHLAALEQDMRDKRQSLLDALAEMGAKSVEPRYAPALFTELTPEQLQTLSQRQDVATIYLQAPDVDGEHLDDAATTDRAYRVWQQGNLGNLGTSMVRPVVHERSGVSDANPYLHNDTHPVSYFCPSVTEECLNGKGISAYNGHATAVAGVIASTHPQHRGIAPQVQMILSANTQTFRDANLVNAVEWARAQGGDPINMSWGFDLTRCGGDQTFFSRYVDWAVRNLWATFVISAGNREEICMNPTADEQVDPPALAWSAIAVGNLDDNNTGFWSDDVMSESSAFRNPNFAPGLEKPEVVAVGTDMRTTDDGGGDHLGSNGQNGSSFAAPQVTGQVALMLSRQPGQMIWPETNKAAVLASAWRDIEPGRERDGVGAVVMSASDETYQFGLFANDCNDACYPLGIDDFPRTYPLPLTANQRVRVAIAWDANAAGGDDQTTLGADIDLHIYKPDGSQLVDVRSASFSNAWELVEFTAPVSGVYSVRANLFRSEPGWPGTFLGMAYSINTATAVPDFCTGVGSTVAVGTGSTTLDVDTANGPTWFDAYSGWDFEQSGREFVRELVLHTRKDVTVTDNNPDLDLHVIQIPSCTADPLAPSVITSGGNVAFANSVPAGTYHVVVDGRSGAVATAELTITWSDDPFDLTVELRDEIEAFAGTGDFTVLDAHELTAILLEALEKLAEEKEEDAADKFQDFNNKVEDFASPERDILPRWQADAWQADAKAIITLIGG